MGDSGLPEGTYSFDADGKLKNGIVAENDSLYYYLNGALHYAGLIEIDGSYYYVRIFSPSAQERRIRLRYQSTVILPLSSKA